MQTIKAYELSSGDKIKHSNGLSYRVHVLSENRNGKIKIMLEPYQNKLSACKRMTVSEDATFNLE